MKMNKYDKALKRCTGDEQEWCVKPHQLNDFIIASDLTVLIRIDKSKVAEANAYTELQYKSELVDRIFPVSDCSLELVVDDIVKLILGVPEEEYIDVHGEMAECSECDGSGRVLWTYEADNGEEYEDYFDCPVCNGRGKFECKLMTRYERNIEINGVRFEINEMCKALEAINDLGHKTATVSHLAPRKPMLIDVESGVQIIIMPNELDKTACSITLKPADK